MWLMNDPNVQTEDVDCSLTSLAIKTVALINFPICQIVANGIFVSLLEQSSEI